MESQMLNKNDKKLKVLFVTRKYPPMVGGMENLCYNLFNGISENLISKKIIALGKKQIHLFWFLPYCIIYVLFNAKKYDAIFLGDGLMCSVGCAARSGSKKVKTIIYVHGLDITYSNPMYQFYIKIFLKDFDKYICNSKKTASLLVDKKTVNKNNIDVLNPGINVSKFYGMPADRNKFEKRYNLTDKDLIMLSVGRLVKRKGIDWFITNVLSKYENKKYIYFVVGEGEEYETIRRSVEKYGLKDKVKILGKIPEEELMEMYSIADIFIMPNIRVENDVEGFGIVAIEASLSGTLVVASSIDGIKDAIVNDQNGFLLESENSQAYLDTISTIHNNLPYFNKKIKDFQDYTIMNYSWEIVCKKCSDIIISLFE